MAQAHVVYTNAAESVTFKGSLFQGKKFWLSRTVPQRTHISEQITNNGGELVELERDADIKIADHAKKHPPPGSYSFTYVTASVRHGKLEDLEDHLAGPPEGTIRNVGSARPAKGTRTPFSREDDELLLKWVEDCERKGGKKMGNEIYKQLEAINPRHTFQSWRDRYLNILSSRPGPMRPRADDSPNSPNRPLQTKQPIQQTDTERAVRPVPFTEEEHDFLLENIEDIMNAREDKLDEMWAKVSEEHPDHTKDEWRNYYDTEVLPAYRIASAVRNGVSSAESKGSPQSTQPLSGKGGVRSAQRTPAVQRHASSPLSKPNSLATRRIAPEVPRNGSSEPSKRSHQRQASQRAVTPPSPLEARGNGSVTPRPSKRKLIELQRGNLSSPISEGITTSTAKQRLMTRVLMTEEVPSTPERHSRSSAHDPVEMNNEEADLIQSGRIIDQVPASQTLTEPNVRMHKNQRVVEETQTVDVAVEEPADEWDDVLDEVDESEPSSTPRGSRKPSMEDMREINDSPTYDESAELDQWIERHVEAGYSEDRVIFALKRTSMDARLAELVLESLAKEEGLPHDIPGIWSEAEDEVLQGTNQRLLRGLERKHGLEAFDARLRFLKTYEDATVAEAD